MPVQVIGNQVSGGIAQLVERLVRNEKVSGSNPLTSTKLFNEGGIAQLVEHLLCKQDVSGSNPLASTICLGADDELRGCAPPADSL